MIKIYNKDRENADLIEQYGFIPYPADNGFFDGKLCSADAPFGIFFYCFLYNGQMSQESTHPRESTEKICSRVEVSLKKIRASDYKIFYIKNFQSTISHIHVALVNVGYSRAIEFMQENKFQSLNLNSNPYLMYSQEENIWRTRKYNIDNSRLIVNVVLYSQDVIYPTNQNHQIIKYHIPMFNLSKPILTTYICLEGSKKSILFDDNHWEFETNAILPSDIIGDIKIYKGSKKIDLLDSILDLKLNDDGPDKILRTVVKSPKLLKHYCFSIHSTTFQEMDKYISTNSEEQQKLQFDQNQVVIYSFPNEILKLIIHPINGILSPFAHSSPKQYNNNNYNGLSGSSSSIPIQNGCGSPIQSLTNSASGITGVRDPDNASRNLKSDQSLNSSTSSNPIIQNDVNN